MPKQESLRLKLTGISEKTINGRCVTKLLGKAIPFNQYSARFEEGFETRLSVIFPQRNYKDDGSGITSSDYRPIGNGSQVLATSYSEGSDGSLIIYRFEHLSR